MTNLQHEHRESVYVSRLRKNADTVIVVVQRVYELWGNVRQGPRECCGKATTANDLRATKIT